MIVLSYLLWSWRSLFLTKHTNQKLSINFFFPPKFCDIKNLVIFFPKNDKIIKFTLEKTKRILKIFPIFLFGKTFVDANGVIELFFLKSLRWVSLFVFTNLYPCPNRQTYIRYLGVNSRSQKTHNLKLLY